VVVAVMVVMVVVMVIWLFIWHFKKIYTLIHGRPLQFNGQPRALEMYYFAGTGANLIYAIVAGDCDAGGRDYDVELNFCDYID